MPINPASDVVSELASKKAAEAAANPNLAEVPSEHRSFFQTFVNKDTGAPRKMNIAGKARPEEVAALSKLGWDGVSDLPLDIAEKLSLKSKEEVLREIEKSKGLTLDDLDEVEYEKAPDEMQQSFDSMLKKMDKMVAPKIIDSGKKPTTVSTSPPATPPPSTLRKTVAELLGQTKPATAPPPPVLPPQVKEEPPQEPQQEMAQTKAPEIAVCKRCKWNQSQAYPVAPTPEDIQIRQLSLGSAIQGGDGRFRKAYKVFGGKITLHFRELTTEGNLIYQTEGSNAFSPDPSIAYGQQMFSIDRINFRRHCCGLERIEMPGKDIVIPPLLAWVKQFEGNVEMALRALDDFIRETCYINESVMMLAGRCWVEFEDLVTALWSDQSFYSGTP